jgi:hypothetical protein
MRHAIKLWLCRRFGHQPIKGAWYPAWSIACNWARDVSCARCGVMTRERIHRHPDDVLLP